MADYKAQGTVLKLSISSTYTAIGQIKSLTPLGMEMGTVESTDLDATAKTFLATILDSGEASFTVMLDPSVNAHAQLRANFIAGTVCSWQIVFPFTPNKTESFSAIITKYPYGEITPEALLMVNISLKGTGLPTNA